MASLGSLACRFTRVSCRAELQWASQASMLFAAYGRHPLVKFATSFASLTTAWYSRGHGASFGSIGDDRNDKPEGLVSKEFGIGLDAKIDDIDREMRAVQEEIHERQHHRRKHIDLLSRKYKTWTSEEKRHYGNHRHVRMEKELNDRALNKRIVHQGYLMGDKLHAQATMRGKLEGRRGQRNDRHSSDSFPIRRTVGARLGGQRRYWSYSTSPCSRK